MEKMKPILFNDEMVRAILDGRKTQTRRVVRYIPCECGGWEPIELPAVEYRNVTCGPSGLWSCDSCSADAVKSPYGKVGDILWVRETFACVPKTAYSKSPGVSQVVSEKDKTMAYIYKAGWERSCPKWKPLIHMPREAARIFLRVTGVRAERVQDISEDDAEAEGGGLVYNHTPYFHSLCHSHVQCFSALWDDLYAKRGYGWDVNPFVFCYEFKVERVIK